MTLNDRLEEIDSLVDEATSGPWRVDEDGWIESLDGGYLVRADLHNNPDEVSPVIWDHDGDKEFVAQARSIIPELVDTVRTLQRSLARVAHPGHEAVSGEDNHDRS